MAIYLSIFLKEQLQNEDKQEETGTIENTLDCSKVDYSSQQVLYFKDAELRSHIMALKVNLDTNKKSEIYVPTEDQCNANVTHHPYVLSNYYSSAFCKKKGLNPIGKTAIHISNGPVTLSLDGCREIESMIGGEALVSWMASSNLDIQLVAKHYQDPKSVDEISTFACHLDKQNLHRATFLSIQGTCYIVLFLDPTKDILGDSNDNRMYEQYYSFLAEDEKTKIDLFLKKGKNKTHGNMEPQFFYMCPGKCLSFPAESIVHGTIIPSMHEARIFWICYDLILTNN